MDTDWGKFCIISLLSLQFFLFGLLYLYRCVTMYVTNLPRAYDTYECASRTNGTFEEVVKRSIRIMLSAGMSAAGEIHTCGDWVFSGLVIYARLLSLTNRLPSPLLLPPPSLSFIYDIDVLS